MAERNLRDKSRGERIQKALAEAGVASRRAVEQMIHEGRVAVNGQVVTELPAWVDLSVDRVTVDGKGVRTGATRRRVCIAVHKPKRVVSTTSDDLGRRTVVDLVDLPLSFAGRLYPIGRLDADSTGLILLTNDGDLAQRVAHPRFGLTKTYRVTVKGEVAPEQLLKLRKGLHLADREGTTKRASVAEARITGFDRNTPTGPRTRLQITLREGQNREVRRLLARLGLNVRKLTRTDIGPVSLKGIGVGQWRVLDTREITALLRATRGGGSV